MSSKILFHPVAPDEEQAGNALDSPFLHDGRQLSHDIERLKRRSRNSTGIKEEFLPGPRVIAVHYDENDQIVIQSTSCAVPLTTLQAEPFSIEIGK